MTASFSFREEAERKRGREAERKRVRNLSRIVAEDLPIRPQ
jgi:hypothetical protein